MKILITQTGTNPVQFYKEVTVQFLGLKKAIQVLGVSTRDHMRDIISTQKHRPLGSKNRLENAINYYISEDGWGVGIGDLQELSFSAPYWYLINYGGMSALASRGGSIYGSFDGINPPLGQFVGTGVGRGYFFTGIPAMDGRIYKMTPKNPVWAMNYIEQTINWLATIWRIHLSGATM